MKKLLCLSVLFISAIFVSSVTAQELDEFVYLPIIIKAPQPPTCNLYEPNDTPGQANWIQNGETQTHCIVPKTDVDWVKFSVGAESEVIIEAADEGGDLELWLYDSNLNEIGLALGLSGDSARIDYKCGIWGDLLAAGTYYARVEHWLNSAEIPSYDITLTINPCPKPVILANYSHWTFYGNFLALAGEVRNDDEIGLYRVKVTTNLFDNVGLIDTGTGYAVLDVLPPNDRTCFAVTLDEVGEWAYYEFETPTYNSTSDEWLQNMTVYGDSGRRIDDSYSIVGFIRNDNDFQVKYVQPVATLYNASGAVIGCGLTYVNSTHLDPGQSSSFELNFYSSFWSGEDVASYRIQVDGDPQ